MQQIQDLILAGQIETAIREAEAALGQMPASPFQEVIGKDLLHLQQPLTAFFNHFYTAMKEEEEIDVKAIYVEMNSFTTQFDRWFLHLLAYESAAGRDNLDWLQDFAGNQRKASLSQAMKSSRR